MNFRAEKTLLSAGQAQVRNEASTQSLPAVTGAAYARHERGETPPSLPGILFAAA